MGEPSKCSCEQFFYIPEKKRNQHPSLSLFSIASLRGSEARSWFTHSKNHLRKQIPILYIYINIRPFFLKYVFHNNLSYLSMGNSGSCPLITGYPSLCLGVDDVLLFPTTAKLIGELLVQQTTSQAASSAVRPTSKTSNLPRTIGKKV